MTRILPLMEMKSRVNVLKRYEKSHMATSTEWFDVVNYLHLQVVGLSSIVVENVLDNVLGPFVNVKN